MPTRIVDNDGHELDVNSDGSLDVTLVTADIEIGAVEIKNDTDDTRAKVGGGAESAALRVTVATDSTGVLSVDDNGASLTVDVGTALPAGTNAIGKLAANSGVDIGDVDVTTVPAPLSTTGGGTEATALRVTVANDSTGVLSVDDNGGSLTIDGTVDTELPAAAALADATANPTVPAVGGFGLVWNGTTWDRAPGNTAGLYVQGNVASGAADSGNPIKVGAKYVAAGLGAQDDGDRVDLQSDARGNLKVQLNSGNNTVQVGSPSDAYSNTNAFLNVQAAGALYNGTTWDRRRGNVDATALTSAARTASVSSTDITNYNGRGVIVYLDFTATPNNTETATLSIDAKDPVSAKYVAITAFTALTSSVLGATPTTETYVYTLFPGAVETAATAKHEVQALAPPRTFRITVTLSAAGSWTFSAGYSLLTA